MATLMLSKTDVERLVSVDDAIEAVERAFIAHATGSADLPLPLSHHVDGGGFHIKAAGLRGDRHYFAAKLNANFPDNPRLRGLPTIQGVLALADGTTGELLALMDSIGLTVLRTGAATAVAARALANPGPAATLVVGCGEQGRISVQTLARVRPLERIYLFDADPSRARALASDAAPTLACPIDVVTDVRGTARRCGVIVTCTPSHQPLLDRDDVAPGTFIAAVGADHPHKLEIAPALMAASVVVTDITAQCASFGDLRHALAAGLISPDHVRAELGAVLCGAAKGRTRPDETIVFDSTGTALQDVTVAALAYERAVRTGTGTRLALT